MLAQTLQSRATSLQKAVKRLKKELARSRQIEALLRRREQHFRSIFDYASIGLAQIDAAGRFCEVNQPFCNLVGYEQAELLDKTSLDITHPDEREADQRLRERLLAEEIPSANLERRYIRQDGAIVWANLNLSATQSNEHGTRYLLAAIENIGERKTLQESMRRISTILAAAEVVTDGVGRKQAEHALRVSEQRFRELFDNASDGILVANQDGIYIDANVSACRMLGYRRDELIGKRIIDLLPENEADRLCAVETYQQSDENTQVVEWNLKQKNGAYLPTEISARILPDGRWMAIVRDISERKRTQSELKKYAEDMRDLYDNAPCGYYSTDRDSVFVQINHTALKWLGYARDELIGKKKITDLQTSASKSVYEKNVSDLMNKGKLRDLELELVRKDGSILPVLLNASAILDKEGKLVTSRSTIVDTTKLAEAHKKLRQAATVFDHTRDAIIVADANGSIVSVNQAFTQITGYQREDVIGRNPSLLGSKRHSREFYDKLWDDLEHTGKWQGEIWDRRKSGEVFPAWECISVVKDESGKVTDYVSVFSDISSMKEAEHQLAQLAYHDPLTGLPNRLLFNDRLAQALEHAKRHRSRVALLLLDLDRFKCINDTLGHAAGDRLLQVTASRLREMVRAEDTVARLGGDEFAVVITELADTGDAAALADKLVAAAAQPLQLEQQCIAISTSIGISIYPDDAEDKEALSKAADIALYDAKDRGKNQYEFYTREMTSKATELITLDRGLRHAIAHGELVLYYQPQIDLACGRVIGVEALVRWDRPHFGLEFPSRFIQAAAESDLIDAIGDWVFDTACAQMRQWRKTGLQPLRLAINLSARQIRKPQFVARLRDKLQARDEQDRFGIDLEITESALQTEENILHALTELKALGVKIVIDDFGTGYSSVSSLKQLPVDILKIDRAFIRGIPEHTDDQAIASAIIAMGHQLGIGVIAEGIETPEQLQFVMRHHCDQAQGFLFSPPVPAAQCEQFLVSAQRNAPHINRIQ